MPYFVDRYSFIMLEYEKVSIDCLLDDIRGTGYLICSRPNWYGVPEIRSLCFFTQRWKS